MFSQVSTALFMFGEEGLCLVFPFPCLEPHLLACTTVLCAQQQQCEWRWGQLQKPCVAIRLQFIILGGQTLGLVCLGSKPALPLTSSVILSKSVNFSGPQSPHLQSGHINSTYLIKANARAKYIHMCRTLRPLTGTY